MFASLFSLFAALFATAGHGAMPAEAHGGILSVARPLPGEAHGGILSIRRRPDEAHGGILGVKKP